MARITFVLDLFDPKEMGRSDANLYDLLETLTRADERYLRAHPETPTLYSSGVVYQEEPPGAEDWQDVPTTMRLGWGDCLPLDALVLTGDYELKSLASLRPGDVIVGDGQKTRVLESAVTGLKPVLAFDLDNGCTLRCSPEHRLFLRDGVEVRAKDVVVGQRLKSASSLPCFDEGWTLDPRLSPENGAWLAAVHAADGWLDSEGYRFAISGDDENPKRRKLEQKARVEAMMSAAGIGTRHHKKYVAVNDRPLTAALKPAGHLARNKRMPSLRLTRTQVAQALEGLQTDASSGSKGQVTYGTTSPTMALQIRTLHRMLGQSVHVKKWSNHGGLGSHPIYRVTLRRGATDSTPDSWKTRYALSTDSVGVKGIREDGEALCGDITTDTGKFYLPESDTVVHNCEDLACWRAAELRVRGIRARAFFTRDRRSDGTTLYHIMVKLPDGRIEDPSRQLGMR